MNYIKTKSTTSPMVIFNLDQNEKVQIESGSMVYHNGYVQIEGKRNGSLGGALAKSLFSGESFFVTTATGLAADSEVGISPAAIGDIVELECGNTQWRLNTGAFLACDTSVTLTSKRQSLSKAVFGGTGGFVILETEGIGSILVNSFGMLQELEVKAGQDLVVDNTHIVCWDANLSYDTEIASGTFGFTSGEGIVCRFKGEGKVYIQTRNLQNFAGAISRFLPGK